MGHPPGIGIAAGIAGLASSSHVFAVIMLNALLTTVWVLLVGYRLLRLKEILDSVLPVGGQS